MALTIVLLLVLAAFALTIAAAVGRARLWVAVLLVVLVELLQVIPLK